MADPVPAISHPVLVAALPQGGRGVRFEANMQERGALAEAAGLLAVDRFVADLTFRRWKKDGVRVRGVIDATVVQRCVITLDPLPATVHAPVDAVFVPEGSKLLRPDFDAHGELQLDPDGPDAPEPFSGDRIDAGAVAQEFFVLALDPWPKKPDAELARVDDVPEPVREDGKVTPFAVLAALRDKGRR